MLARQQRLSAHSHMNSLCPHIAGAAASCSILQNTDLSTHTYRGQIPNFTSKTPGSKRFHQECPNSVFCISKIGLKTYFRATSGQLQFRFFISTVANLYAFLRRYDRTRTKFTIAPDPGLFDGAAIMGNGRAVLVINAETILRRASKHLPPVEAGLAN